MDKLSPADKTFDDQVEAQTGENESESGEVSSQEDDSYDTVPETAGSALDDLAEFFGEVPKSKKRKVHFADESPRPKKRQRLMESDSDSDDEYYQEALLKQKSKKDHETEVKRLHEEALKKGIEYTLDDGTIVGKRSAEIMLKARPGLRKKKIMRNPRTRNREKYRKALIKRASQVQKMRKPDNKGEATGINARVVKSTPLK